MALERKRRLTAKERAARRSNGRKSRGPATAAGKARAAAANVQHGYYSKAAEVALTALGEDPAEFKRRLDSLVETFAPGNALEMGLVYRNARALWRMDRYDRIAESIVVKHLEQSQIGPKYVEALAWLALNDKLQRLQALLVAIGKEVEPVVSQDTLALFAEAQHDLPPDKAKEFLRLLVRLRKPGTAVELEPELKALIEGEEIPEVDAEGRKAAFLALGAILGPAMQRLEEQRLEPADVVQEQFERDMLLAKAQEEAAEMNRWEESSLRQVWRTTQLLMKIKKAAENEKMLKMKGGPSKLLKTRAEFTDKKSYPSEYMKTKDLS